MLDVSHLMGRARDADLRAGARGGPRWYTPAILRRMSSPHLLRHFIGCGWLSLGVEVRRLAKQARRMPNWATEGQLGRMVGKRPAQLLITCLSDGYDSHRDSEDQRCEESIVPEAAVIKVSLVILLIARLKLVGEAFHPFVPDGPGLASEKEPPPLLDLDLLARLGPSKYPR
ncbi:hypothetical protein C8R44DRAFT_746361 [Mycena epipterygia]|nr:hypothetical protein C8R44DRAFT_746361 [Mycena epipterygia]